MDKEALNTCNVFGVNVAISNMDQAVQDIKENIKSLQGHYVCFTNVHTIVTAHENPKYAMVQNEAYKAFPDGKPVSLYMNRLLQDPKRLWKRYLKTNLKFLCWSLKGD